MKHYMKLHKEPFMHIKSGLKTIELRLCDEKRKAICVGDEIEFSNTADKNQTHIVNKTPPVSSSNLKPANIIN